jgi:4-amino-4-deoxy-L-arabinose transferase-like glycosyltransferase
LSVLVAALGLAGLTSIPPVDRDEPLFAEAAREMLESGRFSDIRFEHAPLYDKPILSYWAQAASAAVFGTSARGQIGVYRLPSVIAIWLATLLTYGLGATLFDRRIGLQAGLLLASSVMVQSQAHQARADALLLATMLGVLYPLARLYMARDAPAGRQPMFVIALFWASLAAAILTKGPVVPALVLLTILALSVADRQSRWLVGLQPRWGIPLFLLILMPWPIAEFRLHGATFFVQVWQGDILPKLVSNDLSHGAPPLSYALLAPLTLWPITLLLPAVMESGWRARREMAVRFCVASIVPGWLLFELAPTKLPHYVMPLIPPLAVLAAAGAGSRLPSASRNSVRIGCVLFGVAGSLIVTAIPWALAKLGNGLDPLAAFGTLAIVVLMGLAASAAWRGRLAAALGTAAACGMLTSLVVFAVVIPRLQRLWLTERTAAVVGTIASPDAAVWVVGYREPSLVFLLGPRTRFVDAGQAVAGLETDRNAVAIVASPAIPEFAKAAAADSLRLQCVAAIDGIDSVHARALELDVWRLSP